MALASHNEDVEATAMSERCCPSFGAIEKYVNNQCTVHIYLGVDADASFVDERIRLF